MISYIWILLYADFQQISFFSFIKKDFMGSDIFSFCLQNECSDKRMKASESKDENGVSKVEAESSSRTVNKPTEHSNKPEPPKDYIHVRARRGQATDSHSLAERVILFILWFNLNNGPILLN